MLTPRTLKILAGLACTFGVLALPAYVGPSFLEPLASYVLLPPFLSIFLFHKLGVPGLLEHNGACGWGLCAPTVFGWIFLAVFWLGVAWLAAWGLARVTARPGAGR